MLHLLHQILLVNQFSTMKESNKTYGLRMGKFFCSVFGHRYAVSKRITSHIKEYQCLHCGEQATTDATGNLSKLTPKLKDINETLSMLYQKKCAHKHAHHSAA